jgi:hypothetical protein
MSRLSDASIKNMSRSSYFEVLFILVVNILQFILYKMSLLSVVYKLSLTFLTRKNKNYH